MEPLHHHFGHLSKILFGSKRGGSAQVYSMNPMEVMFKLLPKISKKHIMANCVLQIKSYCLLEEMKIKVIFFLKNLSTGNVEQLTFQEDK